MIQKYNHLTLEGQLADRETLKLKNPSYIQLKERFVFPDHKLPSCKTHPKAANSDSILNLVRQTPWT